MDLGFGQYEMAVICSMIKNKLIMNIACHVCLHVFEVLEYMYTGVKGLQEQLFLNNTAR